MGVFYLTWWAWLDCKFPSKIIPIANALGDFGGPLSPCDTSVSLVPNRRVKVKLRLFCARNIFKNFRIIAAAAASHNRHGRAL